MNSGPQEDPDQHAFAVVEAGCPVPQGPGERVTLAEGGGGRLTHELISEVLASALGTDTRHDGARITVPGTRLVTTTDAFVVNPLFFPGGDIGALAVHGTINDLAMCGARPIAITAAFIIEEGLPRVDLARIARSMGAAASAAGVGIASGDTKVVERGHGDGLYLATSGIGVIEHDCDIHPESIRTGDAVIVSGDLGRHGLAVLSAREGLASDPPIESDQQSLWPAVAALLDAGITIHCLRDLTRGGLATCAVELAETTGIDWLLDEAAISVSPGVQAACELLGLDPLHVANEGRFLLVLPQTDVARALEILRGIPATAAATLAGRIGPACDGRVRLQTRLGTLRHISMLSTAQLPRIC